jgi:hypothetical protein
MDFGGKPSECAGMCDCPFATVNDSSPEPNPSDPGEGHYDCALIDRPKVWGEDPPCTPNEWRLRAVQELKALLPTGPAPVDTAFHTVDAEGRGKCLAIVFQAVGTGITACGREAYGDQTPEHMGAVPQRFIGLACPTHGGPPSRVFRTGITNGTRWCAMAPDHIYDQERMSGFGDTPEDARAALRIKQIAAGPEASETRAGPPSIDAEPDVISLGMGPSEGATDK